MALPDLSGLPEVALPPDSGAPPAGVQADDPRVRQFLAYFQGPARTRMAEFLAKSARYEPLIQRSFAAQGPSADLGYLPMVESGYEPGAVSRADAVGMWQFMRPTGEEYGLRVDSWLRPGMYLRIPS